MKRGEASITHGHKRNYERSRTYVAWMNMRARCDRPNNKSYKDYGARGIYYSPQWIRFENFLRDMGECPDGLTLDRIDFNGPYYKENCRWLSRQEQNLNKRNCVRYTLNGESLTLPEWSRRNGIGPATMLKRIQRGVPVEIALTHKGFLKFNRAAP